MSTSVSLGWSVGFLKKIDDLNQNHCLDKKLPIALILTAEEDERKALTTTADEFLVFTIAKTNLVYCKTIGKVNEVKSSIEEAKKKFPEREVKLLVINAHGARLSCRLGEEEYTVNDLKEEQFKDLAKEGEIFLLACRMGDEARECFAKSLAEISNRKVYASPLVISSTSLCYSYCKKHDKFEIKFYEKMNMKLLWRMFFWNKRLKSGMYCFEKGKKPISCDSFSKESSSYFFEMKNYAKNLYKQNDINGSISLGSIYFQKGDLKKAKKCLLKVSKNSKAQFILGRICLLQTKFKEAEKWLEKSAIQEYADAQFALGSFYEALGNSSKGTKSQEALLKAKIWYEKLALKGKKDAHYRLCKICEKEGNEERARYWYLEYLKTPKVQCFSS
jgi:tetratricopeptide (TPR) repeat protein